MEQQEKADGCWGCPYHWAYSAQLLLYIKGKAGLNVDTERITISEVKKGSFQEIIPVNGIVLPVTTIYLDA